MAHRHIHMLLEKKRVCSQAREMKIVGDHHVHAAMLVKPSSCLSVKTQKGRGPNNTPGKGRPHVPSPLLPSKLSHTWCLFLFRAYVHVGFRGHLPGVCACVCAKGVCSVKACACGKGRSLSPCQRPGLANRHG